MGPDEVEQQLQSFRRAQLDSSRPALPLTVLVTASLTLGLGVALLGWPDSVLVTRALAFILVAAAYLIPTQYRKRLGLFGYQGQARQTNLVWALTLVTLFVCGLTANSVMATIFAGLGIISAVTYFFALRGWGMPK
ncbi:hypothetical protein ACNHUS_30550 [Actinomycetes bacterium M1A6_2h]